MEAEEEETRAEAEEEGTTGEAKREWTRALGRLDPMGVGQIKTQQGGAAKDPRGVGGSQRMGALGVGGLRGSGSGAEDQKTLNTHHIDIDLDIICKLCTGGGAREEDLKGGDRACQCPGNLPQFF